MKLQAFLTSILLVGALSTGTADAASWEEMKMHASNATHPIPQTIKVLVAHDQPGVMLEVTGKYRVYDPNENTLLAAPRLGKKRYIQAISDPSFGLARITSRRLSL